MKDFGINNETLMTIITFIYCVATIAICYFNYMSAKAAKEQTKEMLIQYEQSHRPYINVHFDIVRNGLLVFVVKNNGNEGAFNTKIRINDSFVNNISDQQKRNHLSTINNTSLYLAPGQELYLFIDSQTQFKLVSKEKAVISVSYNDKYEEKFEIDLNQYSTIFMYKSPIDDMSNHLKAMKEENKKFHNNVIRELKKEKNDLNRHIIVHEASVTDVLKLEVYRVICMNQGVTEIEIAKTLGEDIKNIRICLDTLYYVDSVIVFYEMFDESNEGLIKWFKK